MTQPVQFQSPRALAIGYWKKLGVPGLPDRPTPTLVLKHRFSFAEFGIDREGHGLALPLPSSTGMTIPLARVTDGTICQPLSAAILSSIIQFLSRSA